MASFHHGTVTWPTSHVVDGSLDWMICFRQNRCVDSTRSSMFWWSISNCAWDFLVKTSQLISRIFHLFLCCCFMNLDLKKNVFQKKKKPTKHWSENNVSIFLHFYKKTNTLLLRWSEIIMMSGILQPRRLSNK